MTGANNEPTFSAGVRVAAGWEFMRLNAVDFMSESAILAVSFAEWIDPPFCAGYGLQIEIASAGRQEVWLYGTIDQPATTPPLETTAFDIPASAIANDEFARRFPDGGDYWSLTWTSLGLLSMWIDPRTGGGPGELWAAPVNN
jgi:hypothetical protein